MYELSDDERDLLLAGLFELWITRSAFDADPTVNQRPIGRIRHDDITRLVVKLGGEPDTAMFGAFADDVDEDAPVPEYPADETDEG